MAHFLAAALQQSQGIADVNPAPETKIHGILEGFDICKGLIDFVYRLSPLDRFICTWRSLEYDLAYLRNDIRLPIFKLGDVVINFFSAILISNTINGLVSADI